MIPTATSLLTLLCSLCLVGRGLASHQNHLHNYPSYVPEYEVRRDTHTNESVTRGRLRYINYSPAHSFFPALGGEQGERMVKFVEFKRHLQCSSPEAELDGTRGGWSLLKMAPPTRQTVEQVCAWAESKCHPWVECRKKVKAFQGGEYDKRSATDVLDGAWGMFRGPVLLRVIDNELHYDWPWGMERFAKEEMQYAARMASHYALLELVLRVVKDIGDSVFFFGGERAFLQWNVPFPTFSFAPSVSNGDMPFPWYESYAMEIRYYADAENGGHNFTDAFYRMSHPEWDKRIPKAAFFASFQSFRQVIFDSAAKRPDLFDVSYHPNPSVFMEPWNPLSDEPSALFPQQANVSTVKWADLNQTHSGFVNPIIQFGDARRYVPEHYKYVVVPVGSSDESSSGRLAALLAHSGAVVLLQESRFAYHFSARLQPWVHYVPLSHSMADVIDKVEWLKRNDHLARRIVRNAQNFALSYLRLEDYLCYAAGSLRLLHDLEKTTDVLESFNATKIVRP